MGEIDQPGERMLGGIVVDGLYQAASYDVLMQADERHRLDDLLEQALLPLARYDSVNDRLKYHPGALSTDEVETTTHAMRTIVQHVTDRVILPELQASVDDAEVAESDALDKQELLADLTLDLMSSLTTVTTLGPGMDDDGRLDPINQYGHWEIGRQGFDPDYLRGDWALLPTDEALDCLGQATAIIQMATGARELDPAAIPQAGQENRARIVDSLAAEFRNHPDRTAWTTLELGLLTRLVVEADLSDPTNPASEPLYTSSLISIAPDPEKEIPIEP